MDAGWAGTGPLQGSRGLDLKRNTLAATFSKHLTAFMWAAHPRRHSYHSWMKCQCNSKCEKYSNCCWVAQAQ